jgi:GT2 family glycosyltransferase
MTDGNERVLVVIPVYDRPRELSQLLNSLRALDRDGLALSIVVVDDASPVRVADQLQGQFADLPITWLRNDTNRGPACSRNRGAASRDSDYVWFLDSDTEVCHPATLRAMVAALHHSPQPIGAVGGVFEVSDGKRMMLELTFQPNGTFLFRPVPPDLQAGLFVAGLSSANLFLRRDLLDRAGGFSLALARDEDNDLCMTLAELGYGCYQGARTTVLNRITDTGRDGGAFAHFADPRKYLSDLLETRIQVLARHHPLRLPLLWLLDLVWIPWIFVQRWRGRFITNRFNKAVPRLTLSFLAFCLWKQFACYALGIACFLPSLVRHVRLAALGPASLRRPYRREPQSRAG